jgi:Arc/MetJ family transcription regulator
MRTTVKIDDTLLARAKQEAAASNRTLAAVIEDALREVLERRPGRSAAPVRLTTCPGNGPRPGVDLDDTAGLLELMEESGDSA